MTYVARSARAPRALLANAFILVLHHIFVLPLSMYHLPQSCVRIKIYVYSAGLCMQLTPRVAVESVGERRHEPAARIVRTSRRRRRGRTPSVCRLRGLTVRPPRWQQSRQRHHQTWIAHTPAPTASVVDAETRLAFRLVALVVGQAVTNRSRVILERGWRTRDVRRGSGSDRRGRRQWPAVVATDGAAAGESLLSTGRRCFVSRGSRPRRPKSGIRLTDIVCTCIQKEQTIRAHVVYLVMIN